MYEFEVPNHLPTVNNIVVHADSFHADDVFAVAVCRFLWPSARIVRTRDPELLTKYKDDEHSIVIDVGGEYDPLRLLFDHHQRGEERIKGKFTYNGEKSKRGIWLAAIGLIWKEFGRAYVKWKIQDLITEENLQRALTDLEIPSNEFCKGINVQRIVDACRFNLFDAIDSKDTGQLRPLKAELTGMSPQNTNMVNIPAINNIIGGLNLGKHAPDVAVNAQFENVAVPLADSIITTQIRNQLVKAIKECTIDYFDPEEIYTTYENIVVVEKRFQGVGNYVAQTTDPESLFYVMPDCKNEEYIVKPIKRSHRNYRKLGDKSTIPFWIRLQYSETGKIAGFSEGEILHIDQRGEMAKFSNYEAAKKFAHQCAESLVEQAHKRSRPVRTEDETIPRTPIETTFEKRFYWEKPKRR